jgi:xanthine dehydrogenase molybdopterin-binding subunit B
MVPTIAPISPALNPDLDVEDGDAIGVVIVGMLMVEELVVEDRMVVLETTSPLMLKVPPLQQEPSNAPQQYWVPPHEDTGAKPPTLDSTIV